MSRIKDYLAEVENIEDLKRPFYMDLGERAYDKAKNREDLRAEFRNRAEFDVNEDEDEYGRKPIRPTIYFENFMDICRDVIEEELMGIIEDNALDIDDTTYYKAIDYGADWLADTLADFEEECIQDFRDEMKEH